MINIAKRYRKNVTYFVFDNYIILHFYVTVNSYILQKRRRKFVILQKAVIRLRQKNQNCSYGAEQKAGMADSRN